MQWPSCCNINSIDLLGRTRGVGEFHCDKLRDFIVTNGHGDIRCWCVFYLKALGFTQQSSKSNTNIANSTSSSNSSSITSITSNTTVLVIIVLKNLSKFMDKDASYISIPLPFASKCWNGLLETVTIVIKL